VSAEVLGLLLADGRTPTGGYAHSGGLEAAISAGLGVDGVPAFARARLYTLGRVQAGLAALAAGCRTLEELLELDREAVARVPVEALRSADRRLGLALLRTGRTLWPDDALLASYAGASRATPRAVALGAVARAGGIEPLQAARLALYEDAAGVAAAAVKLTALDGARASAWVAGLAGAIEQLAGEACVGGIEALPSTSTPLLDLRAARHAASPGRLFAS
jgi:urease accessory protein